MLTLTSFVGECSEKATELEMIPKYSFVTTISNKDSA